MGVKVCVETLVCRGGFCELGAPGKYRNGALYICTYLPRSTLRFLFVVMLAAAQWCPMVVSNVSKSNQRLIFINMLKWDSLIYIYIYSFRRHFII